MRTAIRPMWAVVRREGRREGSEHGSSDCAYFHHLDGFNCLLSRQAKLLEERELQVSLSIGGGGGCLGGGGGGGQVWNGLYGG